MESIFHENLNSKNSVETDGSSKFNLSVFLSSFSSPKASDLTPTTIVGDQESNLQEKNDKDPASVQTEDNYYSREIKQTESERDLLKRRHMRMKILLKSAQKEVRQYQAVLEEKEEIECKVL